MGELIFALLGATVVVLTWASVITTVVVPRRSRARVGLVADRLVDGVYRTVTRPIDDYARRDRWLASQASATILAQLLAWLVLFYLGFALLLLPFTHGSAGDAFAQAGSSLLTLGYAGPDSAPLTAIDYLAAATGMVVVALQIGYLPTLYAAFNRRETEVTLLVSRAGSPPWGPEILARTRFGIPEGQTGVDMAGFYASWERWAADLAESHSNYPILTRFRSPHELSSWLVALLAVLDSAALWLALSPTTAPVMQARLCLRMGFTALRSIADSVGLEVDEDPDPDSPLQLSYDEYLGGVARITSTTFATERTPAQAWPDFRGWRVNYEAVAYALADRLDAVPGPWTGPRRTGDSVVAPQRPANRLPTPHVED
ncbi:MAG TPA: hypothetical protein VM097_02195 [Mycobacteriales bacterium]|nr:hypothetical protein [Mycobacteriales bacterium]